MFGAVETGRHKQMAASTFSDIASLHGGQRMGSVVPSFRPQENQSLVDLNALDTRSKAGIKSTDLSLLNKQQKRRPGGSLASAASQHLKNRPSSPNLNSSRGNLMTSMSSNGNQSPLNPRFSPSPRSSTAGTPTTSHGFFPPRRGPGHAPGSPKSPGNPPRMSSIEIIAMEEKIKELQSQIMEKDDQLRKSLSMQSNHNPVMDEKIMRQYASLEQENMVLSKELNEKNKELVVKLKELQQKEEVIQEMEMYTNEQFEKITQYESERNEQNTFISGLEQENRKLQALVKEATLKVDESNQNLIKQRHNIKFEYDAIIENKMKANEKLNSKVRDLETELGTKSYELNELYSFLTEYIKDVNIYIPVNILKEKLSVVAENEALLKINTSRDSELTKLFELSMNDMIYPTNFNPNSPDLVNNSDISPSVFSDVPATYTHQNNSYVTSISRSSSIYSKQNKSLEQLSKSLDTTPEKPQDSLDKDNKLARLPASNLLAISLKELKTSSELKESVYQDQIRHLNESLTNAKYLIAKLSYTNSHKHKQHHHHVYHQQQQLLKLSNSLSSLLLSASPADQTPLTVSPSTSMLSLGNQDTYDRIISSRSSESHFSHDLSSLSNNSDPMLGKSGLRILNIIPPVLNEEKQTLELVQVQPRSSLVL